MKTLNFFKRFVGSAMILLAMATPMFTSCYDDSALNEQIEELQKEVDQIKSDLAALKAAAENGLSVLEVNEIEGGYELVMSDGSKITLRNGADGEKGEKGDKGDTGSAGAKGEKGDKGDTGAQGEKGDKGDTGAQGEKGDKGDTGAQGEKGDKGDPGEDGDAFFKSVELSEDGAYLVITLIDGTVYKLPMGGFNIMFDAVDYEGLAGEVVTVPYTLAGVREGEQVYVRILAANNCTAVVESSAVKVTLAEGEGYVDLYALNNTTGELKARTLEFTAEGIKVGATEFTVSPLGGDVEVPVTTAQDYEVEIEGDWLTYVETKAVREETVVLTAEAANTTKSDLKATVKFVAGEKTLATLNVVQKNYYPELIEVDGEPVEWAETFDLYRNEDATGDPAVSKKGVFTFALSDDFSKGVYKISNMFMAALYYGEGYQQISNKGGEYYADVEGDVLTIYMDGAVKSYGFTEDIEVAYDATAKTFSIAETLEGMVYGDGFNRTGYLANYQAAVKVDAPAGDEDSVFGNYLESFNSTSTSTAAPGGYLTIEASDNDAKGNVKITAMLGQTGLSLYGTMNDDKTEIVVPAAAYGDYSPSAMLGNFGPCPGFTLTISNGMITLPDGVFNTYPVITGYSATK